MRSTEQGGFSAFAPGKQLETWAGRAWVNDIRTRLSVLGQLEKPLRYAHNIARQHEHGW
jgi:hypothetical protein